MSRLPYVVPDTEYVWICCECRFDSLGIQESCFNCGHRRCIVCDESLALLGAQDRGNYTHQGETGDALAVFGSSRGATMSHTSGLRSGRMNSHPSPLNGEAAKEERQEMGVRPGSRVGCACSARVQVADAQSSSPHEPQHVTFPKEPWQEHTDNVPEDFECREGKEGFENDSTYSEAYTSTDLESSSSTFGDKDNDKAAKGIPGGWESEDINERATAGETTLPVENDGKDLRLLPWLLWNVLRIWWWLRQDWQAFWTTNQHEEPPAPSAQSGLAARQQQGSGGGKRRREQVDSADEVEWGKPSASKTKRARRPKELGPSRPLACPFCKKDLQQYQVCVKLKLTKVRYVKQHLHRKHRDDIEDWAMARLRLRSAPGTEEEQWYRIFDLLFPGHSPRPATPYNDFTVSERPQPSLEGSPTEEAHYVPGVFLTREFVRTLQQSLVQDPALVGVAADDIRRALDRGLSRAYAEQTSHQNTSDDSWHARTQQSSETDVEDSEEGYNNRGFVPGREAYNSSSNSAVENEQSSATTQSDPSNSQRRQRRVGGTTGRQEMLHNSSLATGGAPEDQHLSLNSQPGLSDEPRDDQPQPGSEWGRLFDTNRQDWLDGWLDIDSEWLPGESFAAQA